MYQVGDILRTESENFHLLKQQDVLCMIQNRSTINEGSIIKTARHQ